LEIHREVPLIDGHNDIPWTLRQKVKNDLSTFDLRSSQPELMTDIPRLRNGGVGAQFWSVYVPAEMQGPDAVLATTEQMDLVYQIIEKYPDVFELARTALDVERIFKSGKIASMIGLEGGHSINNSLAALRMFYRMGARYMTLTHSLRDEVKKIIGLNLLRVWKQVEQAAARLQRGRQPSAMWFEQK
jgi:membrane dipeptidase